MSVALSPTMAALLERMLAEDGPQPDATLLDSAVGRALVEAGNRRWNVDGPTMARVEQVDLPPCAAMATGAIPMRVLVPTNARPGLILFIHGGGFAFCSPATHDRCARFLADHTRMPVVLPEYRLAPEHPYPAGLHDVVACLRGVSAATGLPAGPLAIAGDSAGANLATVAMLHEAALGRTLPAAALLFYGVFDADFTTASYRDFAAGPGLTTDKMRRYWDWYCPPDARRDPLVAPLLASDAALQALPPLFLLAAAVDPLLSDTMNFAARLAELGRSETVHVAPGVVHGFLQMTKDLPEARAAMRQAADALLQMI